MKKTIYLVRHGESEGNRLNHHQGPDTPLSDIGLDQARLVGHRFKDIQFDTLLSSPYKRAKQTAQEIAKTSGKKIEEWDLIHEFRSPTSMIGTPYTSQQTQDFWKQRTKNMENKEWHFADEENVYELRTRSKKVLTELEKRAEKRIVLVAHSAVISGIAVSILTQHMTELSNSDFFQTIWNLGKTNTGVSVIEHHQANYEEKLPWRLQHWNDVTHLG